MKLSSYDRSGAEHLLPLLRSIASEILERSDAIEALEEKLLALRSTWKDGKASDEYLNVQSELSNQRREARLSRLELSRLGCTLDEDRPLRVLIPGEDGSFDAGYAWDGTLDAIIPATAAAT
ncbi:MAG: DUF2203 family protein [Planctomycetes bacterium]|nr:DUF2203 family protein [Planctomycetota bacterium]